MSQGASHRRLKLSSISSRGVKGSGVISGMVDDKLRVEDVNEFDDDFIVDDDAYNYGHVDDRHVSRSEGEECQADHSVFDLYEKMFKLRSNPLGLERFSREEKVQIELLQLLRDLTCLLKAFTLVLNWAAQSNASGHVFQMGCQPTREKGDEEFEQKVQPERIDPKREAIVPALFTEDGVHGIL